MSTAVAPAMPISANNPGPGASLWGRVGVRYPSPFFDLSQAYFPQDFRALFRWCRFYALTYGPIYTYVQKMSSYALTRLVWGEPKEPHSDKVYQANRDNWKELLEDKLEIYESCQRLGMHYFTYGNGYASMHLPFRRLLVCPKCNHEKPAREFGKDEYRWKNFRFEGTCEKCKTRGKFKINDQLIRSSNGMRIKIWNPENVLVLHNEMTDEVEYYYRPSHNFSARVRKGERRLIERTPWAFIRAIQKHTYVKFDPTNFFHIKASSPDSEYSGLGYPPILAAIKDVFHLQLLKRAQEAGAVERAIPFPIVHPQPFRSESPSDPIAMVNLQDFANHVRGQIDEARKDLNYIAISPAPVGVTHLWGEGKNLLMVGEIRAWTELIVASLGVPIEFIFGGLSFSGSSVSLRMLENQILSFREGYRRFSEFVIKVCARFLDWAPVPAQWKPFKMAEDVQIKQLMMTLSQMRKVGDRTLLSQFDLDPDEEFQQIQEAVNREGELQKLQFLAQAEAQAEAMKVQERYAPPGGMMGQPMAADPNQMPAQGPPGGGQPVSGEENVVSYAMAVAERLIGQSPEVINEVLAQLHERAPQLAQMVLQMLQQGQAGQGQPQQQPTQAPQQMGGAMPGMQPMQSMGALPPPGVGPGQGGGIDQTGVMQPLPEQRPPRRGPDSAVI